MILPTRIGLLAALLLLAACTAVGHRTLVSVGYYQVDGHTFEELDRNIQLHGPRVSGIGQALASTDLKMLPNVKYHRSANQCSVSKARITVQARVTLPRHANEKKLKQDLAKAWENLSEYAQIHETVHLAIADRYALLMEEAILALAPEPDCNTMKGKVADSFSELFQLHHEEQLAFDEAEKIRIQRLIAKKRQNSEPG